MEPVVTRPNRRKPRLLRRWEVADLLGVSPNTVSRWAREGRLPTIATLGGHRRFKADVVEDLMKRKPDESAPQDQDEES